MTPANSGVTPTLAGLNHVEHDIVTKHYGLDGTDPQPLSAVAAHCNTSGEETQQVLTRALAKMAHPSATRHLTS